MNTTTSRTVAVLALGLGLVLTGCSASDTPTVQPTTDTSAVATTPAPVAETPVVETPAAPVAPVAGAVITSDAETAAAEAAGLGVFDVFDEGGTYVNSIVFDKAAPLPEPVKAAIAAPITAAFDYGTSVGLDGLGANDVATPEQAAAQADQATTATSTAKSASKKSGRNVVVVFKRYTGIGVRWAATSADSLIRDSAGDTSDQSIAVAQAWIAAQPNPETYDIVIAG